jgi:hypothetical protein
VRHARSLIGIHTLAERGTIVDRTGVAEAQAGSPWKRPAKRLANAVTNRAIRL